MNDLDKLYRIMQHTVVDVLFEACGRDESNKLIRSAGLIAGKKFAEDYLDLSCKLFTYIRQLQRIFKELNVGILRVERAGSGKVEFVLDCSRHAAYGYTICCYGEGLLAGMVEAYMNENNSLVLSDYSIQLAV